MSIGTTLRLLTKATGLSVADLATAIPRAGVGTVTAWMKGDKLPGRDQIDAIARTFGVPAGALLSELASTFDPARTKGEHALLASYRALNNKQQGALLEVARSMAAGVRDDETPIPARATRQRATTKRTRKPA